MQVYNSYEYRIALFEFALMPFTLALISLRTICSCAAGPIYSVKK